MTRHETVFQIYMAIEGRISKIQSEMLRCSMEDEVLYEEELCWLRQWVVAVFNRYTRLRQLEIERQGQRYQ